MKQYKVDALSVKIMPTRQEMGEVAARDIRDTIISLLKTNDEINMIFAAAPSQNEVLDSLIASGDIDWSRINAYHMDEYIGLGEEFQAQSFGNFLTEHIFGRVNFKSVNLINCKATDAEAECDRYEALLRENPPHIVVMGIGENGHIAFNDPWVADFNDARLVKKVALDEVCRQQQVNDGCFKKLSDVPEYAMTLTCPMLMSAPYQFCIVPAKTKAVAVRATLSDEISEKCPATILRRAKSAILYLDSDSSSLLSINY